MKINLTKADLAILAEAKDIVRRAKRPTATPNGALVARREGERTVKGIDAILAKHEARKAKTY